MYTYVYVLKKLPIIETIYFITIARDSHNLYAPLCSSVERVLK